MADFTRAIMKPNGQALQIGDNDSGRFLKLHPKFHKAALSEIQALYQSLHDYTELESMTRYWLEDHLNHSHLIRAIDALFGKQDGSSEPVDIEARIVGDLAGGKTPSPSNAGVAMPDSHIPIVGADSSWNDRKQKLDELSPEQRNTYEIFSHEHDLKSGLKYISFPDFGLYLMVSHTMFLSIRCGPVGQNGNGGHAHNDALSIELQIGGIDRITDPGSYLYTPLPEIRNAYRSVKAHFAPQVDQREPNPIDHNLFQMEDRARAQCLYFGDNGFI
jgi:hypothetical protein